MNFSKSKLGLEIKKFWQPFLLFFLIFFLIFNWSEISWIFNYKALSIFISNFFENKNQRIISEEKNEEKKEAIDKEVIEEFEYSEKENILEIPRIEISAPFFLLKSDEEEKILETLNRGVVMFSDFSLPGQPGQTIILGHSARHDWPKSNPAWVFTYLRDVIEGEEIILHFEHRKYTYYVTKKFTLKEGEELPSPKEGENILMLITCWPPGRLVFKQKLVVEAKLKK